jgi:hypothetical protein
MKIRTVEQLYDALADELVWRKKEITSLKFLTQNAVSAPDREAALIRASVTMLYAHWEGFVRAAALLYVELVAFQRLRNGELARQFLTLSVRKLLRAADQTDRIKAHLDVTDFFLNNLNDRSALPYKDAIRTEANLSSRVLKEITDTLGLDYAPYETKKHLIDEGLLDRRNTIAHGESLEITVAEYLELATHVVELLDTFLNQVTNAAALKRYSRPAA